MDKIDQAIFEHFCQAENFKTAAQIHQHFPKVHLRLVQEFWAAVEKELRTKAKENWKVKLANPINKIESDWRLKLGYYFEGDIMVIFEDLAHDVYYGLLTKEIAKETMAEIRELIKEKIVKSERELEGRIKEEKNNMWPIRIFYGFNFSDPNQIEAILPNNRAEMVQEFANNLFDLAEMLEPNIQEVAAIIAKHSSS